ncbi:MAG: alpha/beta hydrolase [Kiritimatiellae bacterium]|nr:alpha/beta hydrolase [Kiritimatiellia bacterium]
MDPTTDNTTDTDPDNAPDADPDGDGLNNRQEGDHGTDPYDDDTDGDLVLDGVEAEQGSDPLDPADRDPRGTVAVSVTFGDPSTSHSEKYRLTVEAVSGDPRPVQTRVNHGYGISDTLSVVLLAGARYAVRLEHVSTDPDQQSGPDLDYELHVSQTDGSAGTVLLIDDPHDVLGTHDQDEWASRAGNVVKLHCARVRMVPDRDRDGVIGESDVSTSGEPLRIWINDDDDVGDTAGSGGTDIPGQAQEKADGADTAADGRRDLLDFFPVRVDVAELDMLAKFGYSLRFRQADEALNVMYTKLGDKNAGWYLKKEVANCGSGLHSQSFSAVVRLVKAAGEELSPWFVAWLRMTGGKGVILVEGRADSDAPLVLEAVKDGAAAASFELPLRVAPVEQMYDRVNLRGGPAVVTAGAALPPSNGKHAVFVHGFNVDAHKARAWNAEMFKRLWQSGSKARFHGVTWKGDIGLANALHYHEDVNNAFLTAPHLENYVAGLSGGKILMAHSLGNMVVSSAIADHGMSVDKYFMFNAAVAAEVFDPSTWSDSPEAANLLVHYQWRGYTNVSWSAKFSEFFTGSATDDRRKLTWKDRLASVPSSTELYNYYSSGDEVLELFSGTPGSLEGMEFWDPLTWGWFAWHKQEVHKGRFGQDVAPDGTSWAGWGFARNYIYQEPVVISSWSGVVGPGFMITHNGTVPPPAVQTESALLSELGEYPVFLRSPVSMFTNCIPVTLQNELLARGIPALSGPVGFNNVPNLADNNINMNSIDRPNGWGRNDDDFQMRWLHGDLKDMAFLYNFKLFEAIVITGDLK